MATEAKEIVIGSDATPPGALHEWSPLTNIKEFTGKIRTQAVKDGAGGNTKKGDLSQVVSGLPSPFARPGMFTYALVESKPGAEQGGLMSFYGALIDEWRGLIAAIALEPSKIRVKRVELTYSDGLDLQTTSNIYEPKGAFGNMLFDKKRVWCDQTLIQDQTKALRPFVDLIFWGKTLVGGTSPESLLFTAPKYELAVSAPFYNETTRKFTDPAQGRMDRNMLSTLYNYVLALKDKVVVFYRGFDALSTELLQPNIKDTIAEQLHLWLKELLVYADTNGLSIEEEVAPEISVFTQEPFKSLFNHRKVLYAWRGDLFTSAAGLNSGDYTEFRGEDLLLDEQVATLAMIDDGGLKEDFLNQCPVYLLKAESEVGTRLFTIPLSGLGIKIFQHSLADVLDIEGSRTNATRLKAVFYPRESRVDITLELWTREKNVGNIRKSYRCHPDPIGAEKLIVWPNFVSEAWNKYYLFSEMPHDSTSWRAFPIVGGIKTDAAGLFDRDYATAFNKQNTESGKRLTLSETENFVRIADSGKTVNPTIGQLLVGNSHKVVDSRYEYEIYESQYPFRGLEIQFQNRSAGLLMIDFRATPGMNAAQHFKDLAGEARTLQPMRVGFDFGSNNTCIAVASVDPTAPNSQPELLRFRNRRISLLASDDIDNNIRVAQPFEMLFFQNDEIWSNQIKSVITLHDERRVIGKEGGALNLELQKVVKGGFMCYEKNIAITESSANRHMLNLPKLGMGQMVHNMKWSNNAQEQAYKLAFLKGILLQTYAELFAATAFPKYLIWAYPSAMGDNLITAYRSIWNDLREGNPLQKSGDASAYALTVASSQSAFSLGGENAPVNSPFSAPAGNFATASPFGQTTSSSAGQTASPFGGSPDTSPAASASLFGAPPFPAGTPPQPASPSPFASPFGGGTAVPTAGGQMLPLEVPTEKHLKVNLKKHEDKEACTEAFAVSRHIVSLGERVHAGNLFLGFDVGGSTADILALTTVTGSTDPVLIKQSSIRFAAGRLADATKSVKPFKNLLRDFIQQKGFSFFGITNNAAALSDSTLPYYFNQIVDRLETQQDLDAFYVKIGTDAKPMMWVNLYLTGVIMFYAGQLARQIRSMSEAQPELFPIPVAGITVGIYGKGGRIFDWFKAFDAKQANEYYLQCFGAGYGPDAALHLSSFSIPRLMQSDADDPKKTKVEVAMGLASGKVVNESQEKVAEILGEDGYILRANGQNMTIPALSSINPSMMQRLGSEFLPDTSAPEKFPRFTAFANIYHKYAQHFFGFPMTQEALGNSIRSMNIVGFARNLPEYEQARTAQTGFDYAPPLIVLEAMCFLENVLMKEVEKS